MADEAALRAFSGVLRGVLLGLSLWLFGLALVYVVGGR